MRTLLITLGILLPAALFAQKRLEGLFEGTITLGGLESSRAIRVEMYLKINQQQVSGRSYVHLKEGKTVEMELRGWFYEDFSIYMEEFREITPRDEEAGAAPFFRKYQLKYGGNFDDVRLTGFWQEVTETPFSKQRQLGRVRLAKVKTSKA